MERLRKNLYTYFRNEAKAKSNDIIWTTRKDYGNVKGGLKGKGYSKGFIVLNQRATNDYAEKHNLAYVYNRFMNPYEKTFFQSAGIEVNEELLALSDLLQWVWRSAIRKNPAEPITIYIPSTRMRNLLKGWLNE